MKLVLSNNQFDNIIDCLKNCIPQIVTEYCKNYYEVTNCSPELLRTIVIDKLKIICMLTKIKYRHNHPEKWFRGQGELFLKFYYDARVQNFIGHIKYSKNLVLYLNERDEILINQNVRE